MPLVGCGTSETVAHQKRSVKAHTVASQTDIGGLRYSASLHPHEEIHLAFKASGYVREIEQRRGPDGTRHLQQGDSIRRGTVLARLEAADQAERVNQARAQHVESEAMRVKAQLAMDRAQRLYESKSLTRPEYDEATAALAAAQARVDVATAQLRGAEIALEDCTLTSPLDGVVLSRSIEVGTLATPGTMAFVLANVEVLEAVFGVPAHEIAHLKLGDALPVSVEGSPAFSAQITALSPSADAQSRVFNVEVAIPNQRGHLRTGMIATVLVPRSESPEEIDGAIAVPLGSVVRSTKEPEGYAVYIVDGPDSEAVVHERVVRLGSLMGNKVAVEEGIESGERVVAMGANLVQDGETVRILP